VLSSFAVLPTRWSNVALVWSIYGVQYGLAALLFSLAAFAAGRAAARVIARG